MITLDYFVPLRTTGICVAICILREGSIFSRRNYRISSNVRSVILNKGLFFFESVCERFAFQRRKNAANLTAFVGSVYKTASAEAGCGERQYEVVAADDVKVENKESVGPVEHWFFVRQLAPSAELCRQFVQGHFQP